MLGLYITIESEICGKIQIQPRSFSKGGIKTQVLMYEDLTTPMYVDIQTIQ